MDEMADVEARLAAAHEVVRQRDTLQRRLAIAAQQLDAAERQLAAAMERAHMESADVDKLESFSGKRVWAVLKGSRASDLEREQAEAEAAHGKVADARLQDLWTELSSASGWSTYDTFLGGGMFSTAIKHDHMDRAARLSRHADEALAVLGRELQDTGASQIGERVTMSDGTRFMDMWFDNIFTDLSVRNQINDALNRTQRVAHEVGRTLERCHQRHAELTSRLNELATERRSLLA